MAGPVYRAREGGSAAREVRDQRGGGCGKALAGAGEGARGQVSGLRKTCAGAEGTGEFLKPSREGFVDPHSIANSAIEWGRRPPPQPAKTVLPGNPGLEWGTREGAVQSSPLYTCTWRNPLFARSQPGSEAASFPTMTLLPRSRLPPTRSCRKKSPLLVCRPRGAGPAHTNKSPGK